MIAFSKSLLTGVYWCTYNEKYFLFSFHFVLKSNLYLKCNKKQLIHYGTCDLFLYLFYLILHIKKRARIEDKYYKDFIEHLTSLQLTLQLTHTVGGREKDSKWNKTLTKL